MLKQGVVQEKISDLTSMNQLPPLGTLPQWSRVNTLNRGGGYPKPFVKDKLQPISQTVGDEEERMVDLSELNPAQRIQYLERSIIFLKQQHTEVLRSLHEEIEGLKKENKDLQFKLIMSQREQQQQHGGSASSKHSKNGKDARALEKESSSLSIQSGYYYLSKTLESSSRGKTSAPGEAADQVSGSALQVPDTAPKKKGSAPKKKDAPKAQNDAPRVVDLEPKSEQGTQKAQEWCAPKVDNAIEMEKGALGLERGALSLEGGAHNLEDGPKLVTPAIVLDGSEEILLDEGINKAQKEDKLDELKIIFLEEEIKELKHALRESRNRNTYLTQVVEQGEESKRKQQHTIDTLKYQLSQGNAESLTEQLTSGVNLFNRPNGQQPSLAECEAVIKRLQHINEQQQHELERLKSDLRDVLYSHKWTPDAYLLAKAYVAEDDARADGKDKALPKLPYKNQSRKLPEIAYIQRDTVNLPALKHTVSNKAMERKKRTQILQKARLKKEVMP